MAIGSEYAPGHVPGGYAHTGTAFPPERDCPIPNAHRRLEDAHKAWHEAADSYFMPDAFRKHLNSSVEALRACILMLQKRTRALLDFDTWHQSWLEAIGQEDVLAWLLKSATHRVGVEELDSASSARVKLMLTHRLPPLAEFTVPVSMLTKDIAMSLAGVDLPPEARNPSFLVVERRWAVSGLETWEILEALAYAYALTAYLLHDAHRQTGDELVGESPAPVVRRRRFPPGALPCMQVTPAIRTIVLNLRTGRLQGQRSQWMERDEEVGDMVAKRFGGVQHLHAALNRQERDPLYFTAKFFEDAKRTLTQQKMHAETVRLYTASGQWTTLTNSTDSQSDRYSVWQRIAAEVSRTGAQAVMMVCDTPGPKADAASRLLRTPSPARREAIVMLVEVADGRHRTLTAPFQRKGDQIRFGRTRVETDGRRWHQLDPVRAVWGRPTS